jgi:hypothetical protein
MASIPVKSSAKSGFFFRNIFSASLESIYLTESVNWFSMSLFLISRIVFSGVSGLKKQ